MQKVDYSYIIETKKLKDIKYIGIESVEGRLPTTLKGSGFLPQIL
jgi:hypothetical protein